MAEKARNPNIIALEAVYAALKDLDSVERKKVLASVFALLGLEQSSSPHASVQQIASDGKATSTLTSRPIGLVELVGEKGADTNAQRIALFAYFREKVEGLSRFGRKDLQPYFASAKLPPASNYDRDFVEAVRKGWIHEDGAESYLTTKGIEAIESGFEGERKHSQKAKRQAVGKRGAKKKARSGSSRKRSVRAPAKSKRSRKQ